MSQNPSDTPLDNSPADDTTSDDTQLAANLIREKLNRIYADEPSATVESAESASVSHRSKHQQFMYELSTSGKDLASVQTEWHNYYQSLPDTEKHQVWQEFYSSQSLAVNAPASTALQNLNNAQNLSKHKHQVIQSQAPVKTPSKPRIPRPTRSTADIRAAIKDKVTAGGKLEAKHHIQSLLFGLGMGAIVLIIFLFGFFNEVIIAPFIQPSRVAAATPLIISSDNVAPTTTPEVIIPKINVEIPVDYSETSTNEAAIENDLEDGVVHYPTTVLPGQVGNAAFFGHSSNNIFNKGKYKFAFVLLHTLVNGDTFYLTYNDKVYIYKVINRYIVNPSDVGVLGTVSGQTATATLITCDPPGTSLNRLIVVGQQISPNPSTDSQVVAAAANTGNAPTELPGNGPTLWTRFSQTLVGKIIVIAILAGIFLAVAGWVTAPKRRLRKLGQL
jgi:sortase A